MPIKFGSDDIAAIFSGSDALSRVYSGSSIVWTAGIIAPSVRGSSTATDISNTSITCNKPTGTQEGDFLVAFLNLRRTVTSITPPSGWTLLESALTGSERAFGIYYKVATASEPSSYTFSANTTGGMTLGIVALQNVDTSNPIDIEGRTDTAAVNTVTCPSVTTTQDNDIVLCFCNSSWNNVTWSAWSSSPINELWDIRAGSNGDNTGGAQTVAWFVQASAGATATKSSDNSVQSFVTGYTVAIRGFS